MYKWTNILVIFSLLIWCVCPQTVEKEDNLNATLNTTCSLSEECDSCYFCGNQTEDYSSCDFENIFCHHNKSDKYEYNSVAKENYSYYFRNILKMDEFCGVKQLELDSPKKSFKILETNLDSNILLNSLHCDYEIINSYYFEHSTDEATLTLKINNINEDENKHIKLNIFIIYNTGNNLRFINLNDTTIRNRQNNRTLNSINNLVLLIDIKNDANDFSSIEETLEVGIETNNPSQKARIIYIIILSFCGFLCLLIVVLIIIYIYVKRKMDREYIDRINHERIEKEKKLEENKKLIAILFESKLKKIIFDKNRIVNDCESCSICIEPFECGISEVSITPCNHIFHFECLKKWVDDNVLNPKCPNCNYELLDSSSNSKLTLNRRNNGNNNNNNQNNNDNILINNINSNDLRRSENITISRHIYNNEQLENEGNGNNNGNNN